MTHPLHTTAARLAGLCLIAATVAMPAQAAAAAARQPATPNCARFGPGQAHDNCLSEASTARASKRPTVAGEDPASLLRNALRRCEALTGGDRTDCDARMHGLGTTSGSVEGGGIYRELVTRQIDAPGPSAPATPPAVPAK